MQWAFTLVNSERRRGAQDGIVIACGSQQDASQWHADLTQVLASLHHGLGHTKQPSDAVSPLALPESAPAAGSSHLQAGDITSKGGRDEQSSTSMLNTWSLPSHSASNKAALKGQLAANKQSALESNSRGIELQACAHSASFDRDVQDWAAAENGASGILDEKDWTSRPAGSGFSKFAHAVIAALTCGRF